MRNEANWSASKFLLKNGRLGANPDPAHVAISSRLNVELLAPALQKLIAQHARGRLLDLGCGCVPLYEVYRPAADSICCVDWVHSGHPLGHVDIAADLNEALPLESASFDTVVLTDVLEHVAQPTALIHEIARVLDEGGALIGSVPFLYRLHEEPHDHHRFTVHALRRLAETQGFQVEHIEAYGCGSDVLFDLLGKLLQTAHWRFGGRWAAWAQAWGLRFRSSAFGLRLNQQHRDMPLGYVFLFRRVDQTQTELAKTPRVELRHIRPGKPMRNTYVERFNKI